jgi:IMP dehydrogenase/GMP reductase
MRIKNNFVSLSFDDVLLVPSGTLEVDYRQDVDLSITIGNPKQPKSQLKLHTPIMIAPMEYITTTKMLKAVNQLGGIGFVHRFQDTEKRLNQINEVFGKAGFAISIDECFDSSFIKKVLSSGCRVILIDTAVGYSKKSIDALKNLREIVGDTVHISTGNVATYESYNNLMSSGADSVRVGIGGGAACITRTTTGFGVPTLASIMDVYHNLDPSEVSGVIADGGIKQNGDIVKSLAAGAKAVMMGSMFAGHDECDGLLDNGNYKFRGLASEEMQNDFKAKKDGWEFHVEGVSGEVKYKGSVDRTIKHMINNMRSGLSYCNVNNILDLQKKVEFIKVSGSSTLESGRRI